MSLIDYFAELISYTLYLITKFDHLKPEYNEISDKYQQLITNSTISIQENKLLLDSYEMGLFAVCAWIDEKILLSNWQDKELWQLNTLQKQHFNTTQAGEKFFEVFETLNPINDKELIEVFNYCLDLGFLGKNFKSSDKNKLVISNKMSNKLLVDYIITPEIKIFPHAYIDQTPTRENQKKRFSFKAFLILTFIVTVSCVAILGIIYNIFLNSQIAGYFK